MRARLVVLTLGVACGGRTGLATATADDAGTTAACVATNVDGTLDVTAIATDERDVVYWIQHGDVVRFDGATQTVLAAAGADGATALAVDGLRVVYTRLSGALDARPRDGGPEVTLAVGLPLASRVAASTGGDFVVVGSSEVMRVGAGGDVHAFWSSPIDVDAAAVDGSSVWVAGDGTIDRVDVATGASSVFATGLQTILSIAAGPAFVYVFSAAFDDPQEPSGLFALAKSGGPPQLIVTPPRLEYAQLAVDGAVVYFTTDSPFLEASPEDRGQLWRVTGDGTATLLEDTVTDPHAAWYGSGFGALAIGPHEVHWLVRRDMRGSAVHEACR